MEVRIAVFDSKGILVKTLCRGEHDPGRHLLEWDGMSEQGKPVPSGEYYIHVDVGEEGTVARFKLEIR